MVELQARLRGQRCSWPVRACLSPTPFPPHHACLPACLQFEGRCADEANVTLALEVNGGAPIRLA